MRRNRLDLVTRKFSRKKPRDETNPVDNKKEKNKLVRTLKEEIEAMIEEKRGNM